ncbi:MAG: type II toxin-antitoxin system HicA family toxin [Patescibacteria group bacterium]
MTAFKPREIIRILETLGYIQKRQTGSHLIMYHPERKHILPIPMHAKDIKHGLLKGIIKQAESTEKEFIKLK